MNIKFILDIVTTSQGTNKMFKRDVALAVCDIDNRFS